MDTRYLPLLSEECAEVVVAICKAQRFGMDDHHPDYRDGHTSNRWAIIHEVGDVLAILDAMQLTPEEEAAIRNAKVEKLEKLATYGPDGTYLRDKQ